MIAYKKSLKSIGIKAFIPLLLLVFVWNSSCKKEEEDPNYTPSIQLLLPASSTLNAFPGEYITVSITATMESGSDENIVGFKLTKQFENTPPEEIVYPVIEGTTYNLTNEEIQVRDANGTEVWTFEVTDDSGDKATLVITITIQGSPPDLKPTISLLSGTHSSGNVYIDGDQTMEVNETIAFGIEAFANGYSGANLTNLHIVRNYKTISPSQVLDKDYNSASITWDTVTVSYPLAGEEYWTITVTDDKGETNETGFVITTTQMDPGILIFTDRQMGSFTSTVNHAIDIEAGTTYTLTELEEPANQAKIDWVYYQEDVYGHTLMSPVNDSAASIYPEIELWTNRKTTWFAKTDMTTSTYNSIANDQQLTILINNGGYNFNNNYFSENLSNPGGIAVGDIIAFETEVGNIGLIKINTINQGATNGESTISFDVKVEKP